MAAKAPLSLYRCDGFKDAHAASARDAAAIFAERLARRDHGKRGMCRSIRLDSRTEDGKSHTFEAFIGKPVPGERGKAAGRNVWLHVRSVG